MDVLKEDAHERRIIVDNLPKGVKELEQKLVIHFQKRKYGGGDVESVSILENGSAIITFEGAEVIDRVLEKKQFFMEEELTVKPWPIKSSPEVAKKVFRCVMAEVDSNAFSCDRTKLKEILRELEWELGLKYREVSGNFLLSGSLQNINDAHDRLSKKAKLVNGIMIFKDENQSASSSYAPHSTNGADLIHETGKDFGEKSLHNVKETLGRADDCEENYPISPYHKISSEAKNKKLKPEASSKTSKLSENGYQEKKVLSWSKSADRKFLLQPFIPQESAKCQETHRVEFRDDFIFENKTPISQDFQLLQPALESISSQKENKSKKSNGFVSRGKPKSVLKCRESSTEEMCPVCLGPKVNPVTLSKCKHVFCKTCVETAFKVKKICPLCKEVYQDVAKGNQPPGSMTWRTECHSLPGFLDCGRIVVSYKFSGGVQGPGHCNPGQSYCGTSRCAYLPDNTEGWEVLRLLKKAFDAQLVFTIGYSMTSLLPNQITWAGIEHKTNIKGGRGNYGYPDPHYLSRVKEQLTLMGFV